MAVCTHCGAVNSDDSKFCTSCGAPLPQATAPVAAAAAAAAAIPEVPAEPAIPAQPQAPVPELTFDAPQPTYTPPQAPEAPQQPVYAQQPVYTQQPVYGAAQQVTPVSTGGLLAWAIISILLCTIPGIVALVKVLGINNSVTVEEQQKKLSSAKTWCIIATVLGALTVLGSIASNLMNS